jgi:uncharacterized protein YfaS (alpha-2-macroglobulin family)
MRIIVILLLCVNTLFGQNYDKKWNQVTALENDGKTKSAAELVAQIYKTAEIRNNQPQLIKCFFFNAKYIQQLEEEAQKKIIANLKAQIQKADVPAQAILNHIYAKCLLQYLNQNRYIIDQRSNTTWLDNDFLTWTKTNFETQITELLEKSIANETLLQKIPLSKYAPIFNIAETENNINANLFDFLLQENINIYTSRIEDWDIKPSFFNAYKSALLGDAKDFINLDFDFIKNAHFKKTIQLYQKQEKAAATFYNRFNRIVFIQNYGKITNETIYKAFEQLQKKEIQPWLAQKIGVAKARILIKNANKKSHPDYNQKAVTVLDSVLNGSNKTNAYQDALALKTEINSKFLSIQLQRQLYNNENARAFISYKNLNSVEIKYYKIDQKTLEIYQKENLKMDSLVKTITVDSKLFKTDLQTLTNKNDGFQYTTEMLLSPLPLGNYLIAVTSPEAQKDPNIKAYEILNISNLFPLHYTKNANHFIKILDRKTGQPLENVRVKSTEFDLKTNKEGLVSFVLPKKENDYYNRNLKLYLSTPQDSLLIENAYFYEEHENEAQTNSKVQLFLDRSIYRPGQTVYYKGIAFKKLENNSHVVAGLKVKITVKDPNWKYFKEIEATTNEFGSFSGSFVLPKTGLTGNFQMEVDEPDDNTKDKLYNKKKGEHDIWDNTDYQNSSVSFKVEEYKRPKFQVIFEPLKNNYVLNQNVQATAKASSYAGTPITEGKIRYTVTRKQQYNFYSRYQNRTEDEIVASGETSTDAKGIFRIDFKALAPEGAIKEDLPVFNYEIAVAVTDNNGETIQAKNNMTIGFHLLALQLQLPQKIEANKPNQLQISSSNLNGQEKEATGDIKVYYIKDFTTKCKERTWQYPEINTIADADFERLFPFEKNEKPLDENQKGTLVYTLKASTKTAKTMPLDFMKTFKAGHYKMEFTALDSLQNLATAATANFDLIQNEQDVIKQQLFTAKIANENPKKDGFASLKIQTALLNIYVMVTASYKGQTILEQNIFLDKNEVLLKIPVTKEQKGSVEIALQAVFENKVFDQNITAILLEVEPKLDIEVSSFRNKIEPGNKETWRFKIKAQHASTQAEVLATMYDKSLDAFYKEDWERLSLYNYDYPRFENKMNFSLGNIDLYLSFISNTIKLNYRNEDNNLNWFGFDFAEDNRYRVAEDNTIYNASSTANILRGKVAGVSVSSPGAAMNLKIRGAATLNEDGAGLDQVVVVGYGTTKKKTYIGNELEEKNLSQIKTRTNLAETAFFLPQIKTDEKGNFSFNFTSPEALTSWKLRLLAHNKNALSAYLEKISVTQKELMVMPNLPRFLTEKDTIVIQTKIVNNANEVKRGLVRLELFDATSMQKIDSQCLNLANTKNFSVAALGNTMASWRIAIPEGVQGIQYKIVAQSGSFSDGEENSIPVLTNNMLVTESIPVWVREHSKKAYVLENLKNNTSNTLRQHQFTFEYTSNPAWIAIQSLPYLMEYEHECAEQTFARFYANALGSEIVLSNPKIAAVFETWRKKNKLDAKLEQNETLKSILLAETPWVNDAKSEAEQKQKMALLFDLEKMKSSQEATFEKLKQKQLPSGGFAWFDGGREDDYITRHILAGLGHLKKLTTNEKQNQHIAEMAQKGIVYLDQVFLSQNQLKGKDPKTWIWQADYDALHYLYARSFYLEQVPLSDSLKKVSERYIDIVKAKNLTYSLYEKAMATMVLERFGEHKAALKILENLKETASNNEDWGMYWIANKAGWSWYQSPIETQAILIEAFAEVSQDKKSVDGMKVWLLKNKQTKNWPTTKSTTEAIYALLMQGSKWLDVKDKATIEIGNQKIVTQKLSETTKEAETGYIKLNWKAAEITQDMAQINIANKSDVPSYGGIYWQYFEDLDKIKSHYGGILSVAKELYLKKTANGKTELQKITTQNTLKIGDLVTVRLIVSSKEDLDYVHLKDRRAACFEPTTVLSGYEYSGGLGFYKSTKDVATHFFFNQINKGTYVLEYDLRVTNLGDFSNGITTIQSMYAPEFSSHSKGIRVKITQE